MPAQPQNYKIRVNADDAGLHPDIDDGIEQCIDAGSLSSVSVMAGSKHIDWSRMRYFTEAGVQTGVHLTWVDEPWLTNGKVYSKESLFLKVLFQRQGFLNAMKLEAERQIETFLDKGFAINHLDSHQHVHHFPGIWQLTEALAKQYKVPYVRVANVAHKNIQRQGIGGATLQYFAANINTDLQHNYCIGLRESGANSLATLRSELSLSRGKDLELIMHPGVDTAELKHKYAAWKYDWSKEREMLADPIFKQVLDEYGYVLI